MCQLKLVNLFKDTQDTALFGEVYHRYQRKIYNTCLGVVKDRDTANDLTQDVMIKVMENLSSLQHGFLLGLWIHRIAKNHAVDHCKQAYTTTPVESDHSYCLEEEWQSLSDRTAKEALMDQIKVAVEGLDDENRKLLQLKYFGAHSIQDLQEQFALSKSAVKMRLSRTRKQIAAICQMPPANAYLQV